MFYKGLRLAVLLVMPLYPALSGAEEAVAKKPGEAWLSMPVSGVVQEVLVEQGDQVKKGDRLVVLEPTVHEARLRAAMARERAAASDAVEARRELDRAQELYDRTVLSTVELQKAQIAQRKVQAEYEEARLHQVQAQYDMDKSVLTAPFDGQVKERRVEVGEVLASDLSPRVLIILGRE